jgi:hypothetical protein
MGPQWVAFARIVLLDTPHLDGAKCRGHWELFDRHPHKDPNRVSDQKAAEALCHECPALLACARWVSGLPPYMRPSGVVGGALQPLPTGSLPTGRHGGRPPKHQPAS